MRENLHQPSIAEVYMVGCGVYCPAVHTRKSSLERSGGEDDRQPSKANTHIPGRGDGSKVEIRNVC